MRHMIPLPSRRLNGLFAMYSAVVPDGVRRRRLLYAIRLWKLAMQCSKCRAMRWYRLSCWRRLDIMRTSRSWYLVSYRRRLQLLRLARLSSADRLRAVRTVLQWRASRRESFWLRRHVARKWLATLFEEWFISKQIAQWLRTQP